MSAPIEIVRARLDAGGWEPRGPFEKFRALCPGHNDKRNPALIVSERPDHSVGIHCLACCDTADVVAALGLEMRDLFVAERRSNVRPLRRKAKPRSRDGLPADAWPIDRVLQRHRPNYRATASPNFWIAECKVCGGELWIHADVDDQDRPSGPVTLACPAGCVTNVRRAA